MRLPFALCLASAGLLAASDLDPATIRQVERRLAGGQRDAVLTALAGHDGPRTLAAALRIFRQDPALLDRALVAVVAAQDRAAVVAALVPLLDDAGWQASLAAARMLALAGGTAARPALLARAAVADDRRRWAVWEGLAALPQPAVDAPARPAILAAIADRLADPHQGVRWAAARVLLSCAADPRARPLLIAAACGEAEEIARATGRALGAQGPAEPPPELLRTLAGGDEARAQGAAAALGAFGGEAASAALRRTALNRATTWAIRAAAVEALGDLALADQRRAPEVEPALIIALADRDWGVRAAAAEHLARLGSAAAVGPLLARLVEAKDGEREAVLLALRGLSGRPGLSGLDDARAWLAQAGEPPRVRPLTFADYPRPAESDDPYRDIASLLLVIDASGSMGGPVSDRGAEPASKAAVVRRDALRVVRGLTPATRINALFFSTAVERWSPGPLYATWRVKARFEERIGRLRGKGDTDLIGVLREALLQPDGDELRIYSDGEPTAGETADPARILADIGALNRLRPHPATIHVVTFADDAPGGFLGRLAALGGGTYRRLP